MSPAAVLRRITALLDHAGIAYMLTGSFASAHYGAPRSTLDIDIVIAANPEQLRKFVQSLPGDTYYADLEAGMQAHHRQSMFNVIDLSDGWKIDLIIRKTRAFSHEEFNRRQVVNVQGLPLFVASPEDVIIAKLEWSKLSESKRQIEDVAAILRARRESLDQIYLKKWIRELDLEKEWSDAQTAAM
ncbi:MAG: DUF6036 family nucleotidyltransferase [Terriglobales bacterium]